MSRFSGRDRSVSIDCRHVASRKLPKLFDQSAVRPISARHLIVITWQSAQIAYLSSGFKYACELKLFFLYELSVRDLPVWTVCRVSTKSREILEYDKFGVGDRRPTAYPLTKSPYATNLTKSENRA